MPTKKPIVQAVIDPQLHEKLKIIAVKEHRKISNIGAIALEEYVNKYESINGEIQLPEKLTD